MDSSLQDWAYFKSIVGNFEGLISYYFVALSHYGPLFRQIGVSLLYSIGLAWIAFTTAKAPIDKLKSAAIGIATLVGVGFLISPTTNTPSVGAGNGKELSVGGYYSFHVIGSITSIFRSGIGSVWEGTKNEAFGGGVGPAKQSLAVAYGDKATRFADQFNIGPGKEAFLDYQKQCGPTAFNLAQTEQDRQYLANVGIGGNTLGLKKEDVSTFAQLLAKQESGTTTFGEDVDLFIDKYVPLRPTKLLNMVEGNRWEKSRSEGVALLQKIPDANNPIDGSKAYKIPTTTHYKNIFAHEDAGNGDHFSSRSSLGGDFAKMNNGVENLPADDENNYTFYPKNCYDLYLIADATMSNFRNAVRSDPQYADLPVMQSYTAISAGNGIRRGVEDELNADAAANGYKMEFDTGVIDTLGETGKSAFDTVANAFNKWVLGFKIPAMVASMALLSVLLLISFPIFAILSIIFGPKILVTYLKLMGLPFLVVLINDLLLTVSANLIAYNNISKVSVDAFMPNRVDTPTSLAVRYTEVTVFSVLTFAEIVIAKLLLWDDVRAATTFNPAQAASDTTKQGAGMVLKTAAVVATAGKGGVAMAAKSKGAMQAAGLISQVSKVASHTNRTSSSSSSKGGASASGVSGLSAKAGGGSSPTTPSGGGSPQGGGGGGGGSPLVPPKP